MITLLYGLAGTYLILLLLMFVFQRNVMYMPEKNIGLPGAYSLNDFSEEFITGEGGGRLQLWVRPANPDMPTIIYFHGNAGNLSNRQLILASLARNGFGVVALNYRGYGGSDGSPNEQGIYSDARAAVHFATDTKHISLNKIILFGESLGSGVAVQMATEFAVAGLALQSPYTSVATRAAEIYYFLPVQWLIHDRFDSIDKIAAIKPPLVIFHGERDRTIPVAHARSLFDKAIVKKQAYYFPEVDHTDFDTDLIASHMLEFAKAYQLIGK